MMHNYPIEEQIKTIREWDLLKKPVKELLDYIEPLWEYGDMGFKRQEHTLELHTLGWSGNEEIIQALRDNFHFWSLYWRMIKRGGHYYFEDDYVTDKLKGFI